MPLPPQNSYGQPCFEKTDKDNMTHTFKKHPVHIDGMTCDVCESELDISWAVNYTDVQNW